MMQLDLFKQATRVYKNRDDLGRFCTEKDYSKRRISYWKHKAEMYERAFLAVTKRLNEINRNGET